LGSFFKKSTIAHHFNELAHLGQQTLIEKINGAPNFIAMMWAKV
jgi:hypothetical protein